MSKVATPRVLREEVVTPKQLAEAFPFLDEWRIRRWLRLGQLEGLRIGTRHWITSLEAFARFTATANLPGAGVVIEKDTRGRMNLTDGEYGELCEDQDHE